MNSSAAAASVASATPATTAAIQAGGAAAPEGAPGAGGAPGCRAAACCTSAGDGKRTVVGRGAGIAGGGAGGAAAAAARIAVPDVGEGFTFDVSVLMVWVSRFFPPGMVLVSDSFFATGDCSPAFAAMMLGGVGSLTVGVAAGAEPPRVSAPAAVPILGGNVMRTVSFLGSIFC